MLFLVEYAVTVAYAACLLHWHPLNFRDLEIGLLNLLMVIIVSVYHVCGN